MDILAYERTAIRPYRNTGIQVYGEMDVLAYEWTVIRAYRFTGIQVKSTNEGLIYLVVKGQQCMNTVILV